MNQLLGVWEAIAWLLGHVPCELRPVWTGALSAILVSQRLTMILGSTMVDDPMC